MFYEVLSFSAPYLVFIFNETDYLRYLDIWIVLFE